MGEDIMESTNRRVSPEEFAALQEFADRARSERETERGRESQTPRETVSKRGQTQKFPWEVWADGKYHTATKWEDFEMSVQDFQNRLYNYARRKELFVYSESHGQDGVGFQFFRTRVERDVAKLNGGDVNGE